MKCLKNLSILIMFAGVMLVSLSAHAFDIKRMNIVCQSESETDTQTEVTTEESKKTPAKKNKKPEDSSEEEKNPEEDCD